MTGAAEPPAGPPSARARLAELFAKLDAFFQRATRLEPGGLTCHAGCDACCQRRFSVTSLEAEAVGEALEALPGDLRARVRDRARGSSAACPALEDDGRCAVYTARPSICRTHGLPIRFARPTGGRALPVLDACPKNFGGRDLGTLDPACVLDQTTLSTVLAALDGARSAELGQRSRERVDLAELLGAPDR